MPTPTTPTSTATLTAFADLRRVAFGTRAEVSAELRRRADIAPVLVFDDATGEPLDLDLRSGLPAIAGDAGGEAPPARTVGRPKLGVVAREITLLPRHWDWLNSQPGGASVALRKLVEDARRVNADRDVVRGAREATYRFMSAIAGHLPGFEEASRALFAGQRERFEPLIAAWPEDVRSHLHKLSAAAWSGA